MEQKCPKEVDGAGEARDVVQWEWLDVARASSPPPPSSLRGENDASVEHMDIITRARPSYLETEEEALFQERRNGRRKTNDEGEAATDRNSVRRQE